MDIKKQTQDSQLTLTLAGRIDTVTAPELEKELNNSLDGVSELILDFNEVSFISSACLRVILAAQKRMNEQGSMKIINANRNIQDVFEMTGFSTFVNIKYKLKD